MRINESALNCSTCKKLQKYASFGFTTDTLLSEAIEAIKQADKSGEIVSRGINRLKGLEAEYTCVACKSRWILSIPDGPMEGSLKRIPIRGERPPCILSCTDEAIHK